MKTGIASALIAGSALLNAAADTDAEKYWPQWRGPYATGVSKTADPPLEWSETKNIRWKVEIPGRGSGTPVIWGDKVFVLTAVPATENGATHHSPSQRVPHKFMIQALDRKTGKVAWERVAREHTPHEGSHAQWGTWASSSAFTDGERVYAFFDSFGLYAYDMSGKLLWEKDLGDKKMRMEFGEGQTPVLHGNYIVVQWDHQAGSFIAALDKKTGAELWRTPRQEIDSWGTPLVVEQGGKAQVIATAMNKVYGYELETGKVIWEGPGLTMNPIPSAVYEDGIAILMSGFRGNMLRAVRIADAKGDIASTGAQVWSLAQDTPYVPSPLLYEGVLYFLKTNSGILSVFDAKTGKPHYQLQRLDGVPNVFASPVGAKGRVYFPGQEGTTLVIKHGPSYEVLAKNVLEDGFNASPALVDNELYLARREVSLFDRKQVMAAKDELLSTLKTRFEKHMNRHPGVTWASVEARLKANAKGLKSLTEMERTGGEPDVVGHDQRSGEFTFYDCSAESPKDRRSLCYDREALQSRKENKPKNSATAMAAAMGVELLTEEQYRALQALGEFDTKTSSWVQTPAEIRKLGGALFCDRRYGQVFLYHNGAESYYAARGFRGSLTV